MAVVGCGNCDVKCQDRAYCSPYKAPMRSYQGIRFTADGFDCALPVAIDQHSTCSFNCLYCFSNYLMRDPERKGLYQVGQWSISKLERFLAGESKTYQPFTDALLEPTGKRAPVQWGALGDPFDNIERWQGWGLQAIDLFNKYNQPVRVSTKGGLLLLEKPYLEAFAKRPDLYWVAFSTIGADDTLVREVDELAPNATDRIRAMKALHDLGCSVTVRLRPILPKISASWRELLYRSREAGARAVSMEFMFVPSMQPPHIKARMEKLRLITGRDLTRTYKQTSVHTACLRASRTMKEEMTFAIRDYAHELGMDFGISDPHWKELNDHGCCCGIPADDPVFGGWQRRQLTNCLVEGRRQYEATGKRKKFTWEDAIPDWAFKVDYRDMICVTGPKGAQMLKDGMTWGSLLRDKWDNIRHTRAPMLYFEGAMLPDGFDKDGHRHYRYEPVPRTGAKVKFYQE